jgi:DNA polymerase (family 10)
LLISLHNHTTWSDGEASVAELIRAAADQGLDEVGISDHYTLSPGGEGVAWSMPLDRLGQYVAEIRDAAAQERALRVRIGLEADYFPETVEDLRGILASQTFDYVSGGSTGAASPAWPIPEPSISWATWTCPRSSAFSPQPT